MVLRRVFLFLMAWVCWSVSPLAGNAFAASFARDAFEKQIKPLLAEYCYDCHGDGVEKGGVTLDKYSDEAAILKDRKAWERVLHALSSREMPPPKKAAPSQEQRDLMVSWINSTVFKYDCDNPDPGRVTIRRLNRAEYNNTIRDLMGIDFTPADDFPADDSGYGFDNIGDVLSMPPILLEKYMAAADKILEKAIVTTGPKHPESRYSPDKLNGGENSDGARILASNGEISIQHAFPRAGEYLLRARVYGHQAGPDPVRMAVRLEGQDLETVDIRATENSPQLYQKKVQVEAGTNTFAVAFMNDFYQARTRTTPQQDRNMLVEYLEIVGPIDGAPPPPPESHARIFITMPSAEKSKKDAAREILANFAKRAYRRPVTDSEVDRLMKLFEMADKNGESFVVAVRLALQGALVSPHFLFRGELQPEPDNPKQVHPINEYALASRLSYFLWSSMPDAELTDYAARGLLRKNLGSQVARMLRDTRSKAMADNFAAQWLQTRNLSLITPDKKTFPQFDDGLREAMQLETELFFKHIVRKDRSVLDFLNADYTFLNDRLARHYGITNVFGGDFKLVSLKGTQRGGLLTQGSVLTITSNPNRTSPVKRGLWVLDNILGTPPPPAPPDVPELEEEGEGKLTGTLRERMEHHRNNPTCASCHARMDPIGFGLENFDAIGRWRSQEGKFEIDASGQLVSGENFKGPRELMSILIGQKKEEFLRCLAEKMLTYALGRGLEYYDKCAVDEILKAMERDNYKFSSLVMGVAKSAPFQLRRGEGER